MFGKNTVCSFGNQSILKLFPVPFLIKCIPQTIVCVSII